MKKLNIAVIGQGRSGRDIHGKYFKNEINTLYNVVAVAELDPERRERALTEFPGCTVYENYTELFRALTYGGSVGLLVSALVGSFVPSTRNFLLPLGAFLEGLVVGGVSILANIAYPGVVTQAILATFCVFLSTLFL